MPRVNVRVTDEMDEALRIEATRIPYRTVSDYLREIIEAALKRARRARGGEK